MSPVSVPWDAEEYATHIGAKNTGKNTGIKRNFRQQFPPGPEFSNPAQVIDAPITITDRAGRILFWFLPDIISKDAQVCLNVMSHFDPLNS